MPSKRPLMRLSRDEEIFLRHWMYDEVHYGEGQGPAKRLQVQHGADAADLAILIAASMPDPADQDAAGLGPPPTVPPVWPWPGGTLRARLADARAYITEPQDYPIAHFEGMSRLARAMKALPAQILEHQYHYEAFGSWFLTLRHHGRVSQLACNGRDGLISIRRSSDRKPPYKYGAEETVGTGKGLGSFDAGAIEQICRALTS